MLHHVFNHISIGIVFIVCGVVWILMAGFAGAMHPTPVNPPLSELIPGLIGIVAGGLIIWWW